MPRKVAITVAALGAALLLAQGFRINRTNPSVASDLAAPPEIAHLLRRACYDCHSNETVWPWYSGVAPVSWLVARDVSEGRAELNFSTWDAYDARKRAKKLKESAAEIAEDEMPPWYYGLMHRDARLGTAERETLRAWMAEQGAMVASDRAMGDSHP